MKLLLIAGVICVAGVHPHAQTGPMPPDIDPQTSSRLPLVSRAQLDENGQRVYDTIHGKDATVLRVGPAAASLHSPTVAVPYDLINQALRKSIITPKYFELSTLIAAREFNSPYVWSAHEPTAQRAGVAPEVIDAVRYNREVVGLPEKDAIVIRFGRELLRAHKIEPALYAKVVELFGREGMVDITLTLGDYVMTAFLLNAIDQQLPAGRTVNLPAK
jgi:4-carboxymuconolactone decarboxylase